MRQQQCLLILFLNILDWAAGIGGLIPNIEQIASISSELLDVKRCTCYGGECQN